MYRIGIGRDFHRFASGRKLVLGGVEISYDLGLIGHSDADVLTHAICDALLGAAAIGDMGTHFPDSDPQYKDISSLKLLGRVKELLKGQRYAIINIDAVILAERPKLAPYFEAMRSRIAEALEIEESQVSVKAKTAEGADAVGKGEGIAAEAIALIESV